MATEKHGIELELESNVAKVLRGVGEAVTDVRGGLKSFGSAASSAFSAAGTAITVFNQGLEIGKKALETFRATIGMAIEKSLEFREVGDETLQWFKEMGRESELVRARLGDALLPVIKGIGEALTESTGKLSDYIEANRKLIATKILEWLTGLANTLIAVAKGVAFLGKIWDGLKLAIESVKVVANEFIRGLLMGISGPLRGLQKMAEMFGADGLAASVGVAAQEVEGIGAVFGSTAQDSVNAIQDISNEIDETERAIARMEKTVRDVMGKAIVNTQEEIQKSVAGTTRTIEEQKAAMEGVAEAAEKAADAQSKGGPPAAAAAPGAGDVAGGALGQMGVVGGAVQGFMQGGIFGALGSVIGEAIKESEGFQKILGSLGDTFGKLVSAVDPLFEGLMPLFDAISGVTDLVIKQFAPLFRAVGEVLHALLTPVEAVATAGIELNPAMKLLEFVLKGIAMVFEGIAAIIRGVMRGILKIFEALVGVWNGIVGAIAGLLRKLGDLSIFGARPLSFLRDWGENLENSAQVSTRFIKDAERKLAGGLDGIEQIEAPAEETAENLKELNKELSDSLTNVPAGLKVALNRFNATVAASPSVGGISGPASAGGRTTIIDTVNVFGADDAGRLLDELDSESERLGVVELGSLGVGSKAKRRATASVFDFGRRRTAGAMI